MKKQACIIDVDGCIADCSHRRHHVEKHPKNWPAFFEGIAQDKVNGWCLTIVKGLAAQDIDILFVSGRGEEYRAVTERWLAAIPALPSFRLFMRPAKDYRPDHEVKKEILEKHILPKFSVLLAVDDRQQVVDMWRENGIVCLDCAGGDF